MNRKPGFLIAGLIALLVVVMVWIVVRGPITVELKVVPARSPDSDVANAWLAEFGPWILRSALVVVFAVGAFFFFRERRRQRAHDRKKPPD